jgi:lipoprotein-releasing system permease protein
MIRQPYSLAIAMRYLRARSQSAFISFISAVSMFGIALSVGVLIIVMAVINGFESELERRILSVVPDARLTGYANGGEVTLRDWQTLRELALEREDVVAASPFVEGAAIATAGERLAQLMVRGVDPATAAGVSTITERIVAGSFARLSGDWTIVIGQDLADLLAVDVGDELRLHTPEVRRTPVGPRNTSRAFTVGGIFDTGLAEFDRGLVFIAFDEAASLYRTRGRATGLSLRVDNKYEASRIVWAFGSDMLNRFGEEYLPDNWARRHSNIFRSIELTKPLLFIVLSLVMAIAAFNIVSTLFMVVREKRGDIAILRTIGSSPRSILNIFLLQGASIGLIGMLGGLALGLVLVVSLGTIVGWIEAWFAIDLLAADVYLIGELPTEARAGEIAQICVLALGLATAATIWPAWRASRQAPAEALRNE